MEPNGGIKKQKPNSEKNVLQHTKSQTLHIKKNSTIRIKNHFPQKKLTYPKQLPTNGDKPQEKLEPHRTYTTTILQMQSDPHSQHQPIIKTQPKMMQFFSKSGSN
jgi:hypothetical protein